MLYNLNLNSIIWVILGLSSSVYGIYNGYKFRLYPFAAGLILLGIGCICCGLTNGFTDQFPHSRLLRKFGALALILGLPITIYYFYIFYGRG
jgi:hypothetical protein